MNTSTAIKSSLCEAWLLLVDSVGVPQSEAEGVWLDLVAHYEENGRYYHNLTHINHMFEVIDMMKGEIEDETAVLFAIWFHDIIYNPRKHNNELLSVAYAQEKLANWQLPSLLIKKVVSLITSTINHIPLNPPVNDNLIFLDADLAILGAEQKRYQTYAESIRQEYWFVPDPIYRKERLKVLNSFLSRNVIYFTQPMQNNFQVRAHQNLQWEANKLC